MKLLDTTLRDGSYVVNFGFDRKQTFEISFALDAAGVDLIEVGHGVGLNASNTGQGLAKETDETYMMAASEAVGRAKWGMFAIPGICEIQHLDACIDYKIGFLRFGVSIDAYHKVLPFIEKAKNAGILVCINFMKSHSRSPAVFEKAARDVMAANADYVYIVDSAGNMSPRTVQSYCERIRDLPFGFHAHNNLGLAVANALEAEQLGAAVIDTSLQGMGRSSGNTMTEHFVALMHRENKLMHINLMKLLDTAEEYVRPLLTQVGHDSVDIICGYAGFHSSYMEVIKRHALRYGIDPRMLIIAVCQSNQSEAPDALVQEKAIELKNQGASGRFFSLNQYFGHEQEGL